MARIRTEEEKEAARQAAKQAKKDQWLREQEEKRPTHEKYMKDAIRQAKKAAALGEVPIGCVIVHDGQVIGRGYNRRNTDKSTLAHAEITAIKRASKKLGDWRLEDCTLYVTLEPCQMCAGAIVQARIPEVMIGCMNPKAGCAGSIYNLLQEPAFNHQVSLFKGVLEEECSQMLKDFFRSLRTCRNAALNLRTVYGHIPDRTTKEKGNIWTFGKDSLPELEEENQSRLQKQNAQRSGIQSWQANSRRQSGSS